MQFPEGSTVIHPHHGPATVMATATRTIGGKQIEYAQLSIKGNDMNVMFPVHKADEIGIRSVAGREELDRLLKVLTGPTKGEESMWSRRYKANMSRIASGDMLQIAAVVRDLLRRREQGGLSQGEKDMLRDASAPLCAEIALAVDATEDQVRDLIESLILEQSDAALKQLTKRSVAPAKAS